MVACFVFFWIHPETAAVFYTMLGVAFVFGVMLVIPIGSADMPVVMSLLNSYAGLAAAATGFVLGNNVLIIAGTLDGFSGFILSVLMCKAMNRSITNVLFGGFGAVIAEATSNAGGVMREITLDDAAMQLAFANRVVFVPGYGLATAQAQHAVRELAELLEGRGVTRQIRHPSRRGPHARTHERAAGRSQCALLPAVRDGADQSRISVHRCGRGDRRQRRGQSRRARQSQSRSSPACPFSKSTAPRA